MICPSCLKEFERTEPGDDFCPFCNYEWVGEEVVVEEQVKLF